ncbi:VOC family protein [Persicitalea sp.]|uniref:VOC family protein n=1 Tax=Persicitalea sp. TaxID=3100273 RepID=UPI0035941CD3
MISRVALTVKDLARSIGFYEKVLNFKRIGNYTLEPSIVDPLFGVPEGAKPSSVVIAVLSLGQESIELLEFQNSASSEEIPTDSASNDLWFQHLAIVVADMDTAIEHLAMFEVEPISPAPQTLPGYLEAAGITAFYFKDPDGHALELIHFPKDKIDPKWKNKSGVFLGIDHTAIAIDDTAHSQSFYEKLGMNRDSQTENYGPEQEKLNQVKDAKLLVTAMKFEKGPGIEFLEFENPDNGRAYPADARPNDLFHWHTVIETENLPELRDKLSQEKVRFISKTTTRIELDGPDTYYAFLVRDPDGHAVMLRSKS